MAQANYTPIQLYRSTTASAVPTSGNLADGELAINTNDGKLYYKDSGGIVQLIASKAGASGDVVGPASATDNAIVRFDGTTGKLVQNSVVTIADSTGDISGVGQLNATTVDTTNLEVTNIKAKDGTAAATIADSTGVVTVTAAPVMTALTASQAVFTTSGKALTSNAITGTGNVVMSASPTLTGTISAAAATLSGNLTLSGGTANGVLYLDGSKVATSGSALTFDGTNFFLNTGYMSFNSNGYIRADSANNKLTFQAGSSGYLWKDNNNSGDWMALTSTGLGIGTSSPSNKLHVTVSAASTAAAAFYNTDTANGNGVYIKAGGSNSGKYALVIDNAASSSLLYLDSSGNLGLGVTPSAFTAGKAVEVGQAGNAMWGTSASDFSMVANVKYDGTLKYANGGVGANRFNAANGAYYWYTAASGTAGNTISFTQAMTLDSSGRLGIGVTNPSVGLVVSYGTDGIIGNYYSSNGANSRISFSNTSLLNNNVSIGSASDAMVMYTNNTERARITSGGSFQIGGASADTNKLWAYDNSSVATCQLRQDGAGPIQTWLGSGGSERARITSGGDLLVGTPTAVAQITSVSSSASNAAGYFNVNAASSTAIPAIYGRKYDNDNTTSQIYMSFQYNQGSGGAGGIQGNGATGVQFYSSSDARLKENIVDLESQLQNIMSLKPSKFDYIDGPKNCIGFIAQQIEVVYPDVIGTTTDGYKTIGGISIMETRLIKAIQEQQALIESLTSRVAQLEGTQP